MRIPIIIYGIFKPLRALGLRVQSLGVLGFRVRGIGAIRNSTIP